VFLKKVFRWIDTIRYSPREKIKTPSVCLVLWYFHVSGDVGKYGILNLPQIASDLLTEFCLAAKHRTAARLRSRLCDVIPLLTPECKKKTPKGVFCILG